MNHTDLIVILDRSGSMSSIAHEMCTGFDQMIADQQKVPGRCNVTLVQFDTVGIDTVYTGRPVQDVPPLELIPRGGTPLLQAVGQTVAQIEQGIDALAKSDRPDKVLFIVITDGEENSSGAEWKRGTVKDMVQRCQKDRGWDFVYLGANVDEFAEGGNLGVVAAASAGYAASSMGVQSMFAGVSDNLASYRAAPIGSSFTFTDEERARMKAKAKARKKQ